MTNPYYALHALDFSYGDQQVLHTIDLNLAPSRFHAIVGPNGSGKSTLLDILSGHRTPTSGTACVNGTDISALSPARLARLTALVPQDAVFNFPFTVRDAVRMGRHPHIPRFAAPSQKDLDAIDHALAAMDLTSLADRPVSELSGGERQRTGLARALAQDTPGLLLDEPTSSMDIRHALATMQRFRHMAENGCTPVAVLHDLNLAAGHCHTVTVLRAGRVHAHGTAAEVLTPETIRAVFGVEASVQRHQATGTLQLTYISR